MHLIMLGFVYALAIQFLHLDQDANADGLGDLSEDSSEDIDRDSDGDTVSRKRDANEKTWIKETEVEETQIVLTPIDFYERYNHDGSGQKLCKLIIPDPCLLSWVRTMAEIIGLDEGNLSFNISDRSLRERFRDTLYEMVCGVQVKTPSMPPLGCSANGVSLLSSTVNHPKLELANLYTHEIRTGRIVDVYVGSDRLITAIGASVDPRLRPELQDIKPRRIEEFALADHGTWSIPDVRWDAERAWETDYRLTALRCRVKGIPRFNKTPYFLIKNIIDDEKLEKVSPCECSPESQKKVVRFPKDEFWSVLDVRKFYDEGVTKKGISKGHAAPEETKWFIIARAGRRVEDQVAVLSAFSSRVVEASGRSGTDISRRILGSCASCAFHAARKDPKAVHKILRKNASISSHIVLIVLAC